MNPFFRASLAWILLLLVAYANGAMREIVFQTILGMNIRTAHQLSCLTGVLLLTTMSLLIWSKIGITTFKQSTLIGLLWFMATALFETFILNRKLSSAEILQNYNIADGEL